MGYEPAEPYSQFLLRIAGADFLTVSVDPRTDIPADLTLSTSAEACVHLSPLSYAEGPNDAGVTMRSALAGTR